MHVLADSAGSNAAVALFWIVVIAAYWVPTFVALARHVPAVGQVVVVNLFLGWTGIGWVVALVLAFRTPQPRLPAAPAEPPRAANTEGYR